MNSDDLFGQADQSQDVGLWYISSEVSFAAKRLHRAKHFYDFFLGSCLLNPKEHANPGEATWCFPRAHSEGASPCI